MAKTKREPTLGDIGRSIGDALARAARNGNRWRNRANTEYHVNWVAIFKRKLGTYMESQGMPIEIWGPHGICARLTIKRRGRRFKRTVAIEPDNSKRRAWRFGVRDYSRPSAGICPLNSIGEINGLNFHYYDLPQSTPLSWFIEKLS